MTINRNYRIDILRIIACFAVIIIHMSGMGFGEREIGTKSWWVYNIYDSSVRWCVPMFVMISGSLFLNPDKKITYYDLFTKYIFRIILAFFFWSAFYVITDVIWMYFFTGSFSQMNIEKLFTHWQFGEFHFWFLPMIIGIYLLIPIIKTLISKSILKYFLILWFVFMVFDFFQPYINSDFFLSRISHSMVTGYSGYFLLGYWLSTYSNLKYNKYYYTMGVISFMVTLIGTYIISNYYNKASTILFDYLSPNVAIMSIAVFIFFHSIKHSYKFSENQKKIILSFSNNSFGIFLIHIFVYFKIVVPLIRVLTFTNSLIFVPLTAVLTYFISYLLILCVRKIPQGEKIL